MVNDNLPDTPYERALMLENMLVAIATGAQGWRDPIYAQLRQEFMNDPELKTLLPQFVRTCRDLRGRVLINRLARFGRSRSAILEHIPYVRGPRRISEHRGLHIFRREPVTDRKAE
jgi:hypothetical protein